MSTPLSQIVGSDPKGEEPKAETPVEDPKPETVEEPKEEPKAEEPKEEPKAEEPKETPAEPPSATDKQVPLAALLDERDKRKNFQKQLEERDAELQELTKEKTDFWEAPEAAINEAVSTAVNKTEQRLMGRFMNLSIRNAYSRHDDYEQAFDAFRTAAEENPALAEQAAADDDPGEYMYKVGNNFRQLDQAGGDVDALREQIYREVKAELLKEMDNKPDVPTPITEEPSASSPREKVEGGPTPLTSILKHNR